MSDGLRDRGLLEQYITQVWGVMNTAMSADERATKLIEAVNDQLAAIGVPAVGWAWGPPTYSAFMSDQWLIAIKSRFQNFDVQDATQQMKVWWIEVIYHEAEHAVQDFSMARSRFGLGLSVDEVQAEMGLPREIVAKAATTPLVGDDARQASELYDSIYGAGRDKRNEVIGRRLGAPAKNLGEWVANDMEYRSLPEDLDARAAGYRAAETDNAYDALQAGLDRHLYTLLDPGLIVVGDDPAGPDRSYLLKGTGLIGATEVFVDGQRGVILAVPDDETIEFAIASRSAESSGTQATIIVGFPDEPNQVELAVPCGPAVTALYATARHDQSTGMVEIAVTGLGMEAVASVSVNGTFAAVSVHSADQLVAHLAAADLGDWRHAESATLYSQYSQLAEVRIIHAE